MEMTLKLSTIQEPDWTNIIKSLGSSKSTKALTPAINARQKEALLPTEMKPASQEGAAQAGTETTKQSAQPIDQARQMAEKANAYLKMADTHLEFRVSEETGRVVVSVVDTQSHEVVRQIPPESLNRLNDRMTQMRGLLYETTA